MINLDLIICVGSVVKKIEREAELRDSPHPKIEEETGKKKRVKGRKVDSDLAPSLFFRFLLYIYIYIYIL